LALPTWPLCVLFPEFFYAAYSLPFYLGGTTFLIAVSVPMDTVAQIHSHLLAHQYEGTFEKDTS
jgi:preprotein translocase subunit SecY